MTKTADCFACEVGYKWNATEGECEACDGDTVVCPTTGCTSLGYPGAPVAAAAAADSSILAFMLSILVALVTLLIWIPVNQDWLNFLGEIIIFTKYS